MLCEHCKQREATTHITETVNGKTTQYHLCPVCAHAMGKDQIFPDFSFNLDNFFGSVLGDFLPAQTAHTSAAAGVEKRCPTCGATFEEIARLGKTGCANCYDVFYDRLLPSIERIHGKTEHAGKIPQCADKKVREKARLDSLKGELAACIKEQEFEKAAQLRDEIKRLEQQGGEQ